MSDKKSDKKDAGFMNFDPAIAASLGERRQPAVSSEEKPKKKDGRGKSGHGGELGQDHTGRSKVTYNISKERQALVRNIAKKEEVHYYDIVEAAIVAFANAYEAGQVDLSPYKKSATSLKAANTLEIPPDFYFSSE